MHYLLEIESVQEIKNQLEEALTLLQEGASDENTLQQSQLQMSLVS